jgi:hypothetical protein
MARVLQPPIHNKYHFIAKKAIVIMSLERRLSDADADSDTGPVLTVNVC